MALPLCIAEKFGAVRNIQHIRHQGAIFHFIHKGHIRIVCRAAVHPKTGTLNGQIHVLRICMQVFRCHLRNGGFHIEMLMKNLLDKFCLFHRPV